jgi:MFS family permease
VQPKIIEAFADVGKLSWLGVAFVLASSSTLITWYAEPTLLTSQFLKLTFMVYRAKLYGIFSAKHLYIGSLVLFEGGSALCGGAPTMNAMIIGRAIAGLGVINPLPCL